MIGCFHAVGAESEDQIKWTVHAAEMWAEQCRASDLKNGTENAAELARIVDAIPTTFKIIEELVPDNPHSSRWKLWQVQRGSRKLDPSEINEELQVVDCASHMGHGGDCEYYCVRSSERDVCLTVPTDESKRCEKHGPERKRFVDLVHNSMTTPRLERERVHGL